MGELLYGSAQVPIPFDDRLLAHLQMVILSRFRRLESCGMSYARELPDGPVRETLWLNPAIPLQFRYSTPDRGGPLNRAWVDELSRVASNGDLHPVPEPDPALDGAPGALGRGPGGMRAARR